MGKRCGAQYKVGPYKQGFGLAVHVALHSLHYQFNVSLFRLKNDTVHHGPSEPPFHRLPTTAKAASLNRTEKEVSHLSLSHSAFQATACVSFYTIRSVENLTNKTKTEGFFKAKQQK